METRIEQFPLWPNYYTTTPMKMRGELAFCVQLVSCLF